MRCWVIYDRPKDFPEHFVLRELSPGPHPGQVWSGPATLHRTVAEARKNIPGNFTRIKPSMTDDPVILEVWI